MSLRVRSLWACLLGALAALGTLAMAAPVVATADLDRTLARSAHAYDASPTSTTPPGNPHTETLRGECAGTAGSPSSTSSISLSVAAKAARPRVSDARLGRALGDDYRGGPNPIGDGSALDAARHTVRTGDLVGGSTHLEKVVEMRDRYARILRRGGLSSGDEAVARGRFGAYRDFAREHRLDEMMRARGLR